MINKEQANKIAEEFLRCQQSTADYELYFGGNMADELGWIFFWGAKDRKIRLAGNCPILIIRDGGLIMLPTSLHPLEEALPEIKQTNTLLGRPLKIDYSYRDKLDQTQELKKRKL